MSARHVARAGETLGPFDDATIRAMITTGALDPAADFFWDEQTETWRLLSELPAAPDTALAPPPEAKIAMPDELAPLAADIEALLPAPPSGAGRAFFCDGCGATRAIEALAYARNAYLCPACNKAGKKRPTENLSLRDNPFETLVVKYALVWAIILTLVPIIGFRFVANLMDPTRGLPPYVAPFKQALTIVEKARILRDEPAAYSVRDLLLEIAATSAEKAWKEMETQKDVGYLLNLLVLAERDDTSGAVALIRKREVGVPTNLEEYAKMHLFEARLLASAGETKLMVERLVPLLPVAPSYDDPDNDMREVMRQRYSQMAQPFSSPLLGGLKVFEKEIHDRVFALLPDASPASAVALVTEFAPAMMMATAAPEIEATVDGNQLKWRRDAIEARITAIERSLAEFEPLERARAGQAGGNAGLTEEKLDGILTRLASGSGARIVSRNVERASGRSDQSSFRADLTLEASAFSTIASFIERIRKPDAGFAAIIERLNANGRTSSSRASSSRRATVTTWNAQLRLIIPIRAADAASAASFRDALLATRDLLKETDAMAIDLADQKSSRLQSDLYEATSALKNGATNEIDYLPAFVKILASAASASGLTSLNMSRTHVTLSGTSREADPLATLRRLLAKTVEEHNLVEQDSRMDERSGVRGAAVERYWSLAYRAPEGNR